jgi:uncharacterized protein (TIGR00369 family)
VSMDAETFRNFFERHVPFNAHLGLEVTEFNAGICWMRLPFRPEWVGDPYRPALHGGLISTLADAAGGGAVFSMLPRVMPVSTIDLRVDYLRPGLLEDLWCEARVLRVGNRVGVTAMRIVQGEHREYTTAEARGVYNIAKSDGK